MRSLGVCAVLDPGELAALDHMAQHVRYASRETPFLQRLGSEAGAVPLPMGRQDIADFLGLTIETVSRTFTKPERDGTIAIVPHGVRLLDTGRVEALAAA